MKAEPFKIVFNDEYIVVVNKIAKLLVHPSYRKEKHTLTSVLTEALGEIVYPCHRLDRETTGLIIYAKTKEVQKSIMEQFKKGLVKKEYFAFVKGKPRMKRGMFDEYIIDKDGARFGEKKKRAKTYYHLVRNFGKFSLLRLIPLTGRTNQIRIHLAKHKMPILGERKYAYRKDFFTGTDKVDFRRLALHASFISFIHPVSKKRVEIRIGLAKDMEEFAESYVAVEKNDFK